MSVFPMNRKPIAVTVEFTRNGKRVSKWFETATKARKFYVAASLQGQEPSIIHAAAQGAIPMTTEQSASTVTPKAKKTAARAASAKVESNGRKPQYGDEGNTGTERTWDLPWNEKKVNIFKAMKALRAVGKGASRSVTDIAAKAGVKPRDVRHYVYHAKVSGLTGIVEDTEGSRGYQFYLTPKGAALDLNKVLTKK